MRDFFKYVFATLVGIFISGFLFILVIIAVVGAISSLSSPEISVKSNSVLRISLSEEIVDRTYDSPFESLTALGGSQTRKLGLNDILESIRRAKTDENITGIYLEPVTPSVGIATLTEIRQALIDFKTSGKFVIAYSDSYTQSGYYMASVADKVYLNPLGLLPLLGLRSEMMFFKGSLEKLGLEPVIFRHGKFKSAIEPLINDKMSAENREQYQTFMNSIWNSMLTDVAASRNKTVEELNALCNNMSLRTAADAVSYGLVDSLVYKDQILQQLVTLSGTSKKQPEFISLGKYSKLPKSGKSIEKNKIAVVYAGGTVVRGDGDYDEMGSERISKAIREAREDSTVKAVVLRVNSGGGDALASEIIWREVDLTRQVKPVIASMGDLAASGGYYVLACADTIVAGPQTITGSIGVFGVLLNAEKFFNQKLGVTFDRVTTNSHADIGSISRPITDDERAVIQSGVEQIYTTFLKRVSAGRNMPEASVDSIGQGRVWAGVDAKRLGLVDELGGLTRSIELAAAKANLTAYRVVDYPKQEDPYTELINALTGEYSERAMRAQLGDAYPVYKQLNQLKKLSGVQALMPFTIWMY